MKKIYKSFKVLAFAAIVASGLVSPQQAFAVEKDVNVWCLKTNTGNYIPLVRVSMMVVPDGANTFDILLKDGKGEAGVSNITFEKYTVRLDLDKYKYVAPGNETVDTSKKCYMFTNTGRFFSLGAEKPMLDVVEGTDLFNVTDRNGNVLAEGVKSVTFERTNEPEHLGIDAIEAEPENLVLETPISWQLQISGCGDAAQAVVYDMAGKLSAAAPVSAGCSTIVVEHLPAGVYVVKVGNKSLKFIKK